MHRADIYTGMAKRKRATSAPPRLGGVSAPPQSQQNVSTWQGKPAYRDSFVEELLGVQSSEPSEPRQSSWVPAFVESFIENMKTSMSYFTAKALSAEEEDKLDSEQKQAYVNEKAEEVERLQRIADEATDAARRGRVSRQRRESLPVSESAEWALKISRSVFAGSSTDRERLNRRMDQEDMCTARDMFEQLVNDAWCQKWLGDPHVLWHGCPLPFNEMSLTDGHPCLLPGEDHRIWASAGPLGAQSMFVHV